MSGPRFSTYSKLPNKHVVSGHSAIRHIVTLTLKAILHLPSDALERNGRSGTMERVPILAGREWNEFHLKNHGTKRNVTTFIWN